jgi:hypothetical protein
VTEVPTQTSEGGGDMKVGVGSAFTIVEFTTAVGAEQLFELE